jgi:hypothetical protein
MIDIEVVSKGKDVLKYDGDHFEHHTTQPVQTNFFCFKKEKLKIYSQLVFSFRPLELGGMIWILLI